MSIECLCVKQNSSKLSSKGEIKAKALLHPLALKVRMDNSPSIKLGKGINVALKSRVSGNGSLSVKEKVDHGSKLRLDNDPNISTKFAFDAAIKSRVSNSPTILVSETDKLNGPFSFDELACSGLADYKMIPIEDVSVDGLESNTGSTSGLYEFINEGVISGPYHVNGETGSIMSDDSDFIRTTGGTSGEYSYKCKLTPPKTWLKDARLHLRARVPYASDPYKTPSYTVKNITLTNSNSETLIEFDEFVIKGDNLFTTYASDDKLNFCETFQWLDHPDLWSELDFFLEFDIVAQSNNDPFTNGFDLGFADAINNAPPDGYPLQISSIEISSKTDGSPCGIGPAKEDLLGIYAEVQEIGNRLTKCIRVTDFKEESDSAFWEGRDLDLIDIADNSTKEGSNTLKKYVNDRYNFRYVKLNDGSNSKLAIEFGHQEGSATFGYVDGAFSFGKVPGEFDTARLESKDYFQNFFKVDELTLRISIRKAVGAPDFPIDVSGYSNDKLLAITPYNSEYRILSTNHLAGSGETVSSKDALDDTEFSDVYEEGSVVNVTNDDEFVTYEIPLTIKTLEPVVGKIWDYSQSTFFEHLILEIDGIEDGTEISFIELCATHAPSNAMNIYSLCGDTIASTESDRSEVQLYPTARNTGDEIVNQGEPLSLIEDIPHRYDSPDTLKTNYSRRWRGNTGLVSGAFDPNMFDFSFENPTLEYPFTKGYFDFSDIRTGDVVHSEDLEGFSTTTGQITSSHANYLVTNSGLRFKDNDLFTGVPGFDTPYKTIDWTSLTDGGSGNLQINSLYGKISDAFSNCVRLDGPDNIMFEMDDRTHDGFSYFIRVSPDSFASFNDRRLISEYIYDDEITFYDLGFKLEFENGYLKATVIDSSLQEVSVTDSVDFTNYSYPLSILVTYNDNNSRKLKLYTDNEIHDGEWTTLRGESAAFNKVDFGTEDVSTRVFIGKGQDSDQSLQMFVCEFGMSTYNAQGTNVVEENADLLYRQVTAQDFLEGHRVKWWNSGDTNDSYKLWSYIDEDSNDWTIGDFSVCMFNSDFTRLTKRDGGDLIIFNLDHDGTSYASSVDSAIPALIDDSLAYHTQIENDFLRFNLSEAVDSFYSTAPRISKNLPYGYVFKEDAIVLDTILEHESNNIIWPDGQKGPKLIISLYTRNKEPYYDSSIENLGLVTRKSYYLDPDQCWINLQSKFDLDSLCDDSEAWSIFPREEVITEFSNKFYAADINDMFIQYDLAYPSGSEIQSKIRIHTSHVRMEHALIEDDFTFSIMPMYATGDQLSYGFINLYLPIPVNPDFEELILYTESNPDYLNDDMILYAGGYVQEFETDSIDMYVEAEPFEEVAQMALMTYAQNRLEISIPMFAANDQSPEVPENVLNVVTVGATPGTIAKSSSVNMYCSTITVIDSGVQTETIDFRTKGSSALRDPAYKGETMCLYVNPQSIINESLPLVLYGLENRQIQISSSVNLIAGNYEDSDYLFWHANNVGEDTEVDDEGFVTKEANDEIRGVDLFGYGNC